MSRHDRETCDICGGEIRILGETELLDGRICRDCADRLSPWFTDDLDCTEAAEIRMQLDGRERNRKQIRNFHPTRKFGSPMMLLVDDNARTFAVTDSHNLQKDNPDILRIEDVAYVSVSPKKERAEIRSGLYRYQYRFRVEIGMDAPEYISEIKYILNEEPLVYESREKGFLGMGGFDPEGEPDYDELVALGEKMEDVLNGDDDGSEDDGSYDVKPGEFDGKQREPEKLQADENGRFQEGKIVKCPWCGCNTPLTVSFTCQHCGGPL